MVTCTSLHHHFPLFPRIGVGAQTINLQPETLDLDLYIARLLPESLKLHSTSPPPQNGRRSSNHSSRHSISTSSTHSSTPNRASFSSPKSLSLSQAFKSRQRNNVKSMPSPGLSNTHSQDPNMLAQAASSTIDPEGAHHPHLHPQTTSFSSHSQATITSALTQSSSEKANSIKNETPPFVTRNQRPYLDPAKHEYPLPFDLPELHRQSLETLLMIQVFGAPVCSPDLQQKPPTRVLELGCGSGFWSMMCHRYFKERGHSNISFTGLDILPQSSHGVRPDADMNWKFVQHDTRQLPWPLPDASFDLIFCKTMNPVVTEAYWQPSMDEFIRLLRPGGTFELWERDSTIRMLRPHAPTPRKTGSAEDDDQITATRLGIYPISASTPLSPPLNTFLSEYNVWVRKVWESRGLNPAPCTVTDHVLLMETEAIEKVKGKRLAIPLAEVRWELEGVGGVVTKDGKSYVETKNKQPAQGMEKYKMLTEAQAALRKMALLQVVEYIKALETSLMEVSGKNSDEWDTWLGKMMADLMGDGAVNWGECLEVGAWSCKKISRKKE